MHIPDFLKKYEKISSTEEFKNNFRLGINKVCKFCNKSSECTSFKNIPHVLPELFGRNNFTYNDECHECNKLFGRFENDLANFISPYQTLLGLKTKKKIPIFQSRKSDNKRSTLIKNIDGKPHFNFGTNLTDFDIDEVNKLMNVKIRKKKFVPINVYKGLVKIGMSLSPQNEFINYSKTVDWLSNLEDDLETIIFDIPLFLMRTKLKNRYYENPSASLYKRKNSISKNVFRPDLCVVVYSGVLVFQIFIPFAKETEKINPTEYKFEYDLFPAFITDIDFPKDVEKLTINMKDIPIVKYNMNFHEKVEENELVQLKFDSITDS